MILMHIKCAPGLEEEIERALETLEGEELSRQEVEAELHEVDSANDLCRILKRASGYMTCEGQIAVDAIVDNINGGWGVDVN